MRRWITGLLLALVASPVSAQNELRIRANFLPALRIDSISAADTLIRAAQLANYPVVDSTKHLAVTLDRSRTHGAPEIIYLRKHLSGADSAYVLRAKEGTTARMHPDSTEGVHAPTVRDYSGERVTKDQNNGTAYSLSAHTNWTDLDTTNAAGTVACYAGDRLQVSVAALWGNEGVVGQMDAALYTSGGVQSYFGGASGTSSGEGVRAWHGHTSVFMPVGTPVSKRVVAGDIENGKCAVKIRVKVSATKTILRDPMKFTLLNLGPDYVAPTF